MTKPFFKWPGSKAWLSSLLKRALSRENARIVEPFAGSAAFFLGSTSTSALLADTNKHVVNCLSMVRDRPRDVIDWLSALRNTEETYTRLKVSSSSDHVELAGRLIFLTNTSWGGLYRENRAGNFNVPYGKNGRRFYCSEAILAASQKLRNSEIRLCSFVETLSALGEDDLVFVDAPYVTKSATQFFDRYHSKKFSWIDQVNLAGILVEKSEAEGKIIVTCAANPDLYNLFDGWKLIEFSRRNSMRAHAICASYRKEALLISPALAQTSGFLDEVLFRDLS